MEKKEHHRQEQHKIVIEKINVNIPPIQIPPVEIPEIKIPTNNDHPGIMANRISIASLMSTLILTTLVVWQACVQNKKASEAILIANETKTIEVSPLVDILNIRLDTPVIGKRLGAHFTIMNVGRAPALVMGATTYFGIRPFIRIDSFRVPDWSVGDSTAQTPLYNESRKMDLSGYSTDTLTQAQFDSLTAFKARIYFSIHAYYLDDFHNKRKSIDFVCETGYGGNWRLDHIDDWKWWRNDVDYSPPR